MENLKIHLDQALNDNKLFVVYQPQYSINGIPKITGVEALARIEDISPNIFIPVLEESDSIIHLGLQVFEIACKQLKEWLNLGLVNESFTMSINLSAKHLINKKGMHDIFAIMKQHKIPTKQICFEITESSFMEWLNFTNLHKMSFDGYGISIDDFGTGYSSLARLKFLPINELKIDKMFVDDLTTSPEDIAIVTAIRQLAKALNLSCVVEGVETDAQFKILSNIGFKTFQGFLFSKPVSSKEIENLLKS